jgi:hypothetical protein
MQKSYFIVIRSLDMNYLSWHTIFLINGTEKSSSNIVLFEETDFLCTFIIIVL